MPSQSSEKLSGRNGGNGDNTARMNSQPPPVVNSQPTLQQIYGSVGNSASKDNRKTLANEDTASNATNQDSLQAQKYIKRGQILRLAKKQTEASS